jgi:molybdopterin molybdotransferase
MVTFEIFARAAVERLAGSPDTPLPILWGKLTREFKQRPGLTRFLPALVEGDQVTPLAWHGSGDIPTLARANAFLVSEPARAEWAAGDWIQVLLR